MVQQVYKSLQGRPEVGPLPTPRYCLSLAALGFTDVSSVFILPLRVDATHVIEPASANPLPLALHAYPIN